MDYNAIVARLSRGTSGPAVLFPDWPSQQMSLLGDGRDAQAAALACEVAFRVRLRRAELGWTRAYLAGMSGLSEFTVLNVESGRVWPDLHTVGRLLEALDLPLAALSP